MKRFTISITLMFMVVSMFAQHKMRSPDTTKPESTMLQVIQSTDNNNQHFFNKEIQSTPKSLKSLFYYEGFEDWDASDPSALPDGWEKFRTAQLNRNPHNPPQSELNWFLTNPGFYPYSDGSYADYVKEGRGALMCNWNIEDDPYVWAITPEITIPETDGNVNLSYWVWVVNSISNGWLSNYHIRVRAEDGTWETLYSYIGGDGGVDNSNTYEEPVVHNMNEYRGQTIRIAFINEWTDGIQMAFDEIVVGEELDDDFAISNLEVNPSFGLLPEENITIDAKAFNYGLNSGTVEVSFLVNGVLEQTYTTSTLAQSESEEVQFTWSAPEYGNYHLQLVIPEDDFHGNNVVSKSIYVNHYYNLIEDFENYEYDELGLPTLVFPPTGWTLSNPDMIFETEDWAIYDDFSVAISGREGLAEMAIYSKAVELTPEDHWISFSMQGVNNFVDVSSQEYPGADPSGRQGFSTFQLKYAENIDGPWTNLGAPDKFVNKVDSEGNLLLSANSLRHAKHDISHLEGTYYFAFTTTSTFELIITNPNTGQANTFYSFVMVDNIMIGGYPGDITFTAKDEDEESLENVTIQVFNESGEQIANVLTNELGTVNAFVPLGNLTYKAAKLGYMSSEGSFDVAVGQEDKNINFSLSISENLYDVTFRVVDQQNIPFEGADVTINTLNLSGSTNAQGEFLVEGFAPGEYNYTISAAEYFSESDIFTITDDNLTIEIDLVIDNTPVLEKELVGFTLFPNPTSNRAIIHSEHLIEQVEVFNILGRRVFHAHITDNQYELNVAGLKSGIYVVRIHTRNGVAAQRLQITN